MSSYTTLSLGSLGLGTKRDYTDTALMRIFRPPDKRRERIDWRHPLQLAKYVGADFVDGYDEETPYIVLKYQCPAATARDRLDLLGFTYQVAQATFQKGLASDIERFEGRVRDGDQYGIYEARLKVLKSLTIESWLEAFSRIRSERPTRQSLSGLHPSDGQLPLLRYMIDERLGIYGFPGEDLRPALRIILDTTPPEEILTYDLTTLVVENSAGEIDGLESETEYMMDQDFLLSLRVIVLTEGDTDRAILERSLKLLYPHLADYFHFFDFTGEGAPGGVGHLANLVRGFAAADVRHRILALFDNDTAAKAALSTLDLDGLPSNIAVKHYPNLPLARNYPTLGPSGEAPMDVNGIAGSIELYLGEDVLRSSESKLSPVQWRGYDRKVRTYQGEIQDKKKVLGRFWGKLASCESHPSQISNHDWDGICAIIDVMRGAFNHTDALALLNDANYE